MHQKETFQLMSGARIARAVNRIARQILEDTRGKSNLILFGVDERGETLARFLSSALEDILNSKVPYYKISVKHKREGETKPEVDITGSHVIIIDDVIFSGKTMYQAFEQVMSLGSPEHVKLAVLIDRGHRIYPIEAQYVGLACPTKPDEHVDCVFHHGNPAGVWLNVDDI